MAKDKKNNLPQPHDATFKKLFSKKYIAKDILEKNLPEEILEVMDMDTLEKLDGSFISEKLEETFSDIIYKVNINNNESYIALLLEHKSYKDKLAIFQVARYIIDIWAKIVEEAKKDIPVVIPIVVYHGKGKWNYRKDIRQLISGYDELPEYIKQRLPVLKHDFVNIGDQNEEKIQEYEPVTRLVVRSMKYIFADIDTLLDAFLTSIDEMPDGIEREKLTSILEILLIYYSAANKDFTEEELTKRIRELDGKGEKFMTILQEREQRGLEQGKQQGIELGKQAGLKEGKIEMARNLIRQGVDIEIILTASKLSSKEIEDIKNEMNN